MHFGKFCAAIVFLFCVSGFAQADTLTFIAQPSPAGPIDYDWFNAANWFFSDVSGNLIPAGRVPLANEGAIIIGTVDAGSGGVRVQSLLATNNAVITNGTFAVENLQMLSGSSFNNATINLLVAMTVGGTNCQLNATTLNILGIASATFKPVAPAPAATLILSQASSFQNGGLVSLTDGSRINGGAGLQSQFVISPGALVTSTDQTFLQGASTNHLIIDNSGTIRADTGTLRFGDGLDWRSTTGAGEFQAASSNALLLFAAPFHVDAPVTDSFTGSGTNRWLAGATLDGAAQVMGNLEMLDSVSGSGTAHVSGPSGVLTWINGAFSAPQINIDAGGNMAFNGGAGTTRQLAGCVINNSGSCSLYNGDLIFSQGATVSNLIGATLDFKAAGTVTISVTNGTGLIDNAGSVRNSGGGSAQFGAPDTLQGPDFNNAGLVDLGSGQIKLLGGASSGEFRTATGAVLWFWGGTHIFNAGSTFTGAGSVRLLQSIASARWLLNDAISVSELELGSNGSVDASGNSSGKPIHFGALTVSDNGILSSGTFEAQTCEMLDQCLITNCNLNILGELAVNCTNCSLNSATLNIVPTATASLGSVAPGVSATLNLGNGSIVQNRGLMTLTDGSQIIGTSPPQNQLIVSPGAILSSTNLTYVQGSPTNQLFIDNSGLIRVEVGTLRFGDGLSWKSSSGAGEFRAVTPASLILFTSPFHADGGVTDFFTGLGTNSWLGGANLTGVAQVGSIDPATQSPLPGNLELMDSVSGTGILRVMGGLQPGLLRWINGTLSLPQLNIDSGGNMVIADQPGSLRHLSGCQLNNSGHCVWLSTAGVLAGSGAMLNNNPGAVLDLQTDTTLAFDNTPPMTSLNNAGTLLKSAGNGSTVLAADFSNSGSMTLQAGAVSFQGLWQQTSGSALVSAGSVLSAGTLNLLGGSISGAGTIDGTVNNASVVSPGTPLGILTIAAGKDYQQTTTGVLQLEIGGRTPGLQYDQLAVGGHAGLGGRLQVSLINGFAAQPGDSFEIMTCAAETGSFSTIDPTGIPGTYWLPRYSGTNVSLVLARTLVISPPLLSGGSLNFSFPTTPGLVYLVEASDNFNPPGWVTIKTVAGDGTVQTFSDGITKAHRFYRVAIQ